MTQPCPACNCTDARGSATHAIVAALMADDLDRAIEGGLLDCVSCEGCSDDCTSLLMAARGTRLRVLAARERYRKRQARLQRRAEERAAARTPPAPAATAARPQKPALPSAAAAALERAKARAAERRKP
jgi:hypothetical protein